ncbi:MAG: nitroreductase family protein [Bacteroidales bacterium]|nr:nitroreductase family protein [Bacteroidales bacterium]
MKLRHLLIALSALTLTAMTSCSNNTQSAADAVLENIHNRKSVRQYTAEPVSEEHIQTMLKAAMAAPSAVNYQPWRFVVVTEREQLDAMAEVLPFARMLKQAPLAIIVCGETLWFEGKENIFWQQDCSAATQNLLLAAEALGLGAVWTGVYPDPQRSAELSAFLGLPETVQPLCAIPIGHPAGDDKPKDKWKPENIHYGKW